MVYRRSMTLVLALLLLAAAPPEGVEENPAPPPAESAVAPPAPRPQLGILPQDLRMEAYDQFRGLYETERFEEALPYARRVVELSESDPEREFELPIAYNNLGATQYQLRDYPASVESYRKSLEMLESTQGISSRRLVVPLAGLGAAYAALDQHVLAAELLDRALAVSRRADGLFNLAQLPLIEQAADSRFAINDFAGVERQRMYALKIAEQNYGYGDERTLPAILQLASFYESLHEFVAARTMYLRARDIAFEESGGYSPLAVRSLLGIARTHRLQYTMNPDTLGNQQARDEITGEVVSSVFRESRGQPLAADRTGLKSAQTALEILRGTSDPPRDLLTETLIELGDWFQTAARPTLSLPYYQEAATILEQEYASDPMAGNPLMAPRMVFYRPPVSAIRSPNTPAGQYVVRQTVFSFNVLEAGELQNITVVSTDMSEGQLAQSKRAISRAIYSPRFVSGKAVATESVTFTGEWYEEPSPQTAPAPVPAPAAAPTPPTSEPGT